jgi:two-component system response regulator YesN
MLIVDDEQFAINGLKNAIEWEKFGIEIIGEATDGQEAIEFIHNNDIDILFTDIKMPIMDGIKLIETIRTEKKNIKIVVLSGYEDFDYARTAIHYNVFEYLLKPVTLDKIEDVVRGLVEQCEDESRKKQKDIEMEKKLQETLPFMEERFYMNLLNGIYEDEIHSFLDLNLKANRYKVIVAHIDNLLTDNGKLLSHRDKQLLTLKIYELLKKELQQLYDVVPIQYNSVNIVLLFKLKFTDEIDSVLKSFERIQKMIIECEDVTISLGIGNSYSDIKDIHYSFKEAMEALKHKLYYGNGSIISYKDIMNNQGSYVDILVDWKQYLIDSINLQDAKKAEGILRDIHNLLKNNNRYNIYYIRKLSMEIILIISLTLYDKNEELESIYTKRENLFDYIQQLETLDDIFDTLIDICVNIIQYLNEKRERKNKSTINNIIRYINENIDQEITLEKIAQRVFLTPNYIGHIFKEEMGISFSEYVTQSRMEFAKKLLKQSENKIYEVSLKVGYKNPHYFSKLFKQYTGFTPSQYKE